MKHLTSLVFGLFAIFTSCTDPYSKLEEGMYADITTNKGSIILKLEFEKTPITVANFVSLAEGKNPFVEDQFKGKPFYDGLKFHRVIPDFMIQGGDPLGDGSGGPGYKFKDEFHPDLKHSKGGILSMANAGPGTNGSQFFITHKETPWLDNMHTVFGEVIEGKEVVDSIAQDDIIEKITIVKKGTDAKKFDAVKIFKDYYSIEAEEQKKEAEIQKKEALKVEKAKADKAVEIEQLKLDGTKTKTGLIYKIISKGEGKKPKKETQVYINYAGFLQNGELFDSNYEDVSKTFGKLDPNRAQQGAYKPFPFKYGDKQGLIAGFIEALELMSYGDKAIVYIPSNLGYGSQGAGNVIPPNADIIFEIEMLENLPN
ncbi:peptidylprolyl isomerase [Flavobacterium sediminilitoris]|uniref:peptidylprolyl isomerase n=1 Tax=Flavobacterium sediminilitoris TaxID=2024526 RepID=A0ABY4HNI5_9FLAO|nr:MULTISPECIES: peptidylprolyl isomerase [Flavobacterium]UOX33826.1 peptidylprolyl isomerase [Flavobacterium sediminilitoris]